MSIVLSNTVINTGNTPNITTGNDANKGSAIDYTFGSVYSAIDTATLYQSDGANWVNLSAGGGGANYNNTNNCLPYYDAFNNLFADSLFYNDFGGNQAFTLDKTGTQRGFYFDFQSNQYSIGDLQTNFFYTDGDVFSIKVPLVGDNFFKIITTAKQVYLGDYDFFTTNNNYIFLGNDTFISYYNNLQKGIIFDHLNGLYYYGDNALGNYFTINENVPSQVLMSTNYNFGANGLYFDFASRLYKFGDVASVGNSNAIIINDIDFTTKMIEQVTGNYFGAYVAGGQIICTDNFTTNTAGSNTTKHLKINVNGTPYVIQLKNP